MFERRTKEPLLNFSQLRLRNVMVSNILAVTAGAIIVLSFSTLAYKLEDAQPVGYGFDILTTGLYILPVAVVALIAAYPLGILNSRFGVKPFLLAGSVIGGLGSILLASETAAIQIPEYLSILSLGFAMLVASRQILLVLSVKPIEMASFTSMNQVFFNVGQSLGPAISASFLSTYVYTTVLAGQAHTFPTANAFQYAFWFGTLLFVVSFLVSILAREVVGKKAAVPTS
jgi:MFS family permease